MDGALCAHREEAPALLARRPRAHDPPGAGRRGFAVLRPGSQHRGGVGECTRRANLGDDDDLPGWVGDVDRVTGRAGQQRHRAGRAAGDALPQLQRDPATRRHPARRSAAPFPMAGCL